MSKNKQVQHSIFSPSSVSTNVHVKRIQPLHFNMEIVFQTRTRSAWIKFYIWQLRFRWNVTIDSKTIWHFSSLSRVPPFLSLDYFRKEHNATVSKDLTHLNVSFPFIPFWVRHACLIEPRRLSQFLSVECVSKWVEVLINSAFLAWLCCALEILVDNF